MIDIKHSLILNSTGAVVELDGYLDSKTSPIFEEYINKLLDENIKHIIIDGGKLQYVSSAGIGVNLFLLKKISNYGGIFILANLSSEITSLYAILGFNKMFTIATSKIAAMELLDSKIQNTPIPLKEEEVETTSLPEKQTQEKEIKKIDPFVVECKNCQSLIRIKNSGLFKCPFCNIEFSVDENLNVKYLK